MAYQKLNLKSEKGVALTIYVLITMGATLIMASLASMAGLLDLEKTYGENMSAEALYLSEGCAEEALRRIRLDHNYGIGVGDINLSALEGECIINIRDEGGGARSIFAQGIAYDESDSSYNKFTYVTVTINPLNNELIYTGWTEL